MPFAMASASANLCRPAGLPALAGSRPGIRSGGSSLRSRGARRRGGLGMALGRGGRMRLMAEEAGGAPVEDGVEDGEIEAAQEETVGEDGQKLPPLPQRQQLSQGMKEKLRSEYIGLGGSETEAMGGNYFLYIAILVAVLAAASKLTGAI